jgi:hypothetical protein
MRDEDKRRLMRDLIHIAEETRQFKPPYIPSRYLQDLANSNPGELVERYVLAKNPTDGFHRLWQEQRLDLTVENVAWKHRRLFRGRSRASRSRPACAGRLRRQDTEPTQVTLGQRPGGPVRTRGP